MEGLLIITINHSHFGSIYHRWTHEWHPQSSCSVVSDSLQPRGLQHSRPPCPSPTPGADSNSRPSSRWCHPTISSSVVPFSCLQSYKHPAAAAAKLLQSCPTLCDPIDGSPPGSPIPGILQARTLEWVAISFSNAWKWKVKSEREVTQSCPTLSDPMDCSPPGSSIHGIFQARVLEWDAIAFSVLSN